MSSFPVTFQGSNNPPSEDGDSSSILSMWAARHLRWNLSYIVSFNLYKISKTIILSPSILILNSIPGRWNYIILALERCHYNHLTQWYTIPETHKLRSRTEWNHIDLWKQRLISQSVTRQWKNHWRISSLEVLSHQYEQCRVRLSKCLFITY